MKKVQMTLANEIKVTNIIGYMEKTVTKFGTGAKIDIPKEFLKKKVAVIVYKD